MYKVHCLLVNEQLSMSRPGDLTQTFPATSQSALFVFGSWRPSDSQEDKSVSKKEMALKKELSRQIQTRRCQEFNRMADDRIWWKYIWIILHLFLAVFWLQLVKRNPSERRRIYGQVQLYKNLAIHLLFSFLSFSFQIARAEKKSRSVELEDAEDFGGNSSLVGRCKEEHRFLKSVVEKVSTHYNLISSWKFSFQLIFLNWYTKHII